MIKMMVFKKIVVMIAAPARKIHEIYVPWSSLSENVPIIFRNFTKGKLPLGNTFHGYYSLFFGRSKEP